MSIRGSSTRNAWLAAAVVAALPAPVLAQTETAALGEIIVTARKREESLQDVPIAVSAISGNQLEQIGAQDITLLSQSVPNLTLEVSRGTNSTLTAFIRGIGQQDPVAGFEAGVGIYVDDVYLNRPQAAVLDIYDVERIEVLRGPQGTLYGRNTIGGAVKYVARRLGHEPMLKLRASGGEYGQREIVATGAAPVTDALSVGGSVAYLARDGFGDNRTNGAENYDKDVLAFRASVEHESESLFVRLSGDWLKDKSNPKGGHRLIPGLLTGAPVLDDVYDSRGGLTGENEAEAYGGALLVEVALNDAWKIRNIAAYRKDDNTQQIDFDALPAADVDVPVIYENRQWTEELQLLYGGDALNGLLGFYYIDASAFDTFDVLLFTSLPGLNANTTGDVDTKSWSVFGDLTLDLEQLLGAAGVELSFGGRYTSDKRSARVLRRTFLTGATPPFGGTSTVPFATTSDFDRSETFTDFSPRVALGWSPHEDHNLYVSYSQGFKGGSFDPRGQTSTVRARTGFLGLDVDGDGTPGTEDDVKAFMQFEPETVDTYELGWKSRLGGGRVTSNLAFFYSDYKSVQIPGSQGAIDPVTGLPTFVGVTTNAGAAELYGVEWEGSARIGEDVFRSGDSLTLHWGGGWLHREYTEFLVSISNVETDVSDLRVIQNTPKFSGSLTATYATPVTWFGHAGELGFSNSYSGKSRTHQFEVPNAFLDQDSYGVYDASLVWTRDDGRLQIGIHGKNLFDRQYKVAGYTFVAQNQDGSFVTNPATGNLVPTLGREGVLTAFYGAPRTVTGTISLKF